MASSETINLGVNRNQFGYKECIKYKVWEAMIYTVRERNLLSHFTQRFMPFPMASARIWILPADLVFHTFILICTLMLW